MEVAENNKIYFLDILVEMTKHSISTSIYRKLTHMDRYLNYRSHHHPKKKKRDYHLSEEKRGKYLHG